MIWLLANWRLVAIASVVAVLGGYGMTMRVQRDNARSELVEFKAQSAKAAWLAAEKAFQETIADQKRKEAADAENSAALAALAGTIKRLRNERPPSNFVPAAPAGSSRPDLACFDRPALERAYGELVVGVRELADEGAAATVGLDTARRWAAGRDDK
jgi:hypothetical protein